jgi:hypothetical protein
MAGWVGLVGLVGPAGSVLSFFLFKTFSFLFSGLSYNFFILAPNELKPIFKFF